jgi:hypothetical protein
LPLHHQNAASGEALPVPAVVAADPVGANPHFFTTAKQGSPRLNRRQQQQHLRVHFRVRAGDGGSQRARTTLYSTGCSTDPSALYYYQERSRPWLRIRSLYLAHGSPWI